MGSDYSNPAPTHEHGPIPSRNALAHIPAFRTQERINDPTVRNHATPRIQFQARGHAEADRRGLILILILMSD